ncbi:N-acetylmuramoyl-L-alanine amidase, partial [Streptomyces sp. NPDC007346]|uniref:N-acetylmuramoyl-L-alanine amidase n=1 Tax=Streptomyces sp. NPDC007346 TaxID=3154682 RepID=UPI00345638FA
DGKDPWPAAQLLAIERAAAAVCRAHGWGERSAIGHLEWQPGKIDPRGFTMDSMRTRIGKRLSLAPAPTSPETSNPPVANPTPTTPSQKGTDMALTTDDVKKVWSYKGTGAVDAWALLRDAADTDTDVATVHNKLAAKLDTLQATVDKLAAAVAALTKS